MIADSTIPFRFKGDLNTSMRKMATNLVLFPRLHFLSFSQGRKTENRETSSPLSPINGFLTNSLNSSHSLFNVYAGIRSNSICESEAVK